MMNDIGSLAFLFWLAVFALVVAALVWRTRASRAVTDATEDVASKELPTIGDIAVRKHEQRYGRAPTDLPDRVRSDSMNWYPKKAAGKRA